MKSILKHLHYIFLIAFTGGFTQAQNWTGDLDSNWNNPGNWSVWPLDGETVTINPANYTGSHANPVVSAASVFTPDGIILQNGAQLTVRNNLTSTDRVEAMDLGTTIEIASGTFQLTGDGSDGRMIIGQDAQLNMSDGTLTCSQRLIADLGGTIVFNEGIINAGDVVAIADGSELNESSFIMAGGNLTTNELLFESESGFHTPSFSMWGGTLQVNSLVLWAGELPGLGIGYFNVTGGEAYINGDIINDSTSTIAAGIRISDSAQFYFNGSNIQLAHAADTLRQERSGMFTLSNTNTLFNNGILFADSATTVFNGNTTLEGNGSYSLHNVTINTGSSLLHNFADSMFVTGNFMNNGIYTNTLNSVMLTGKAPQFVGGTTTTTFYDLSINNPYGVLLNHDIHIANSITLIEGILSTTAVNSLTMLPNAISQGGSDSSYVDGPIIKTGNTGFVFPLGKANKFAPMEIGPSTTATNLFTAEYFRYPAATLSPMVPPLMSLDTLEYWKLQQTGSDDSLKVRLYWKNANESNIFNCDQLAMAWWNGSGWYNIPAFNDGSCLGAGSGYIESNNKLFDFGLYTFGTYDTLNSIYELVNLPQSSVNIYPNPVTKDNQIIITGMPINQQTTISIRNSQGQIVYTRTNIGADRTFILTDFLPVSGIYMVGIENKNQRVMKRLIVK